MSKEANVSSRRSAIVVFDFEQVEDLTIIKCLFKVNNKDTRVIPTDVFYVFYLLYLKKYLPAGVMSIWNMYVFARKSLEVCCKFIITEKDHLFLFFI